MQRYGFITKSKYAKQLIIVNPWGSELQATEPFIKLYREQLVPWLKAHDMQLRQVFVKGAASPEGPYSNNVRLSRERTRRLIAFLSQELGQQVDEGRPIDAKSVTEDYGQLVKLMRQAGDADYERVNAVWEQCQGDEACCKRKLMAMDGGRLWTRLKGDYFAQLRQARVMLWFGRRQDAHIKPLAISHDFTWRCPRH